MKLQLVDYLSRLLGLDPAVVGEWRDQQVLKLIGFLIVAGWNLSWRSVGRRIRRWRRPQPQPPTSLTNYRTRRQGRNDHPKLPF